jgi:hypothetical protein
MDRWPTCDRLSSTLRFSAVTAPEAERFVATTWRILVENALVSPRIKVRREDSLIDIGLRFSCAEDCTLVERRFHQILQSTGA